CVGFAAVLTIGRAGEVVRPVALPMRDRRVRPAASFVTIMIERLYDTMTVVLMFAINLLWLTPTSSAAEFGWVRIIGFSFLGVLLVGIAFLIWFRRRSAAVIRWLVLRIESRSILI